MVTICYQNLGASWAIGLKGENRAEITEFFDMFWNHGAIGSEKNKGRLLWMNENVFGYFWTDHDRFMAALASISLHSLLNNPQGPLYLAAEREVNAARELYRTLPEETPETESDALFEELMALVDKSALIAQEECEEAAKAEAKQRFANMKQEYFVTTEEDSTVSFRQHSPEHSYVDGAA